MSNRLVDPKYSFFVFYTIFIVFWLCFFFFFSVFLDFFLLTVFSLFRLLMVKSRHCLCSFSHFVCYSLCYGGWMWVSDLGFGSWWFLFFLSYFLEWHGIFRFFKKYLKIQIKNQLRGEVDVWTPYSILLLDCRFHRTLSLSSIISPRPYDMRNILLTTGAFCLYLFYKNNRGNFERDYLYLIKKNCVLFNINYEF